MARKVLNYGTTPGDGTGDILFNIFKDIDDNFGEVYETKKYFTVDSDDTFSVPDSTTPSFITGLTQVNGINGFTIDSATGSVRNTSGKDLIMTGNVAMQYTRSGVGDTEFFIYSQKSSDGINWTANTDSLRYLRIDKDGIGYKSIVSFLGTPWANGDYIRFMFGKTGNTLEFQKLTQTLGGVSVSGHAFFWTMQEQ